MLGNKDFPSSSGDPAVITYGRLTLLWVKVLCQVLGKQAGLHSHLGAAGLHGYSEPNEEDNSSANFDLTFDSNHLQRGE